MKKSQRNALAAQIHALAVESADAKKTIQKIAALIKQSTKSEANKVRARLTSRVRGLVDKLEPAKGKSKKPVAAKKKTPT